MRHRCSALVAAFALLASLATVASPSAPASATPTIGHVFTIVLENTTWEDVNSTTGRGQMPYLHGLESQGVQLDRMYGVSHASLTNDIAMTRGNPPNARTQADCFSYNRVFEAPADQNIGDQLETAGFTWGSSQSVSLAVANSIAGVTVGVTPATIAAGGTAVLSVTATSTAAAVRSTVDLLATGSAGAEHVIPVPVDVIRGTTPNSQVRNGNFESGVIAPWTFPSPQPPTLITPGALGAGAIRQHDSTSLRQGGILVPAGAKTFELRVRIACTDVRNYARATVRDSVSKITTVLVPNVCANTGTWSTITVPATARRGHKVGIALLSHKALAAQTSIDVGWDEVTCR